MTHVVEILDLSENLVKCSFEEQGSDGYVNFWDGSFQSHLWYWWRFNLWFVVFGDSSDHWQKQILKSDKQILGETWTWVQPQTVESALIWGLLRSLSGEDEVKDAQLVL